MDSINYANGSSIGIVIFCKDSVAKENINKIVNINGCIIHILECFSDMSPFPVPYYQILVESDNLPTSWEKHVIVKDFFVSFAEVTGIYFLRKKTSEGIQRLVISFKEDLAGLMAGTIINVPWDKYPIFYREVSSLTLGL